MTLPFNTPGSLPSGRTRPDSPGPWPRQLNLLAALWLFLSAFIWPEERVLRMDTWVTAVLMFGASLAALRVPRTRYWNTVLAIWLLFSTFVMRPTRAEPLASNMVVGVVVLFLSLLPSRPTSS